TTTTDPDGGKTETKTDSQGDITTIDKTWSDGDKTHVELDHTTNVIRVTETPHDGTTLATVVLNAGEQGKSGRTTATNNLPNNGVQLTHDIAGVDTEGNHNTGTDTTTVDNSGNRTYTKDQVPDG
ncbi:hypothetical protein, partial [Secundilactobacillus folii]|uniref:hypothetical protein n=1 Tax=Secundilactobacillus folii TaxID=2678357 RepID=UPI001566AFCC